MLISQMPITERIQLALSQSIINCSIEIAIVIDRYRFDSDPEG
jgi:hypothetical protein